MYETKLAYMAKYVGWFKALSPSPIYDFKDTRIKELWDYTSM